MRKALLIFFVCLNTFFCRSQEQEKFNITGGIGIPELINLGGRFQFNQTELGFSVGTFPEKDEDIISLQANLLYHFAGASSLSPRRPWYLRGGLTYSRSETEFELGKYFFLDLRIGRDFNFSEKFGIQIDLGGLYIISENIKEKKPQENYWFWDIDLEYNIIPIIGITFFYRI
ncbi:hypothetical protein [Christiangramia sediminis]|uniref:Uncharacterized protein n=1 Tax=Christiangramia sediminis TaxID=2881336 RepID=A0A9X1RXP3_9FLAO|nr:hypothetical protein [Christiangramia sediminis]MCB7481054.1 hypothetical protein [Christiangramia sediminis]